MLRVDDLQSYLYVHGLEALTATLGVFVRRSLVHDNLVHLKYNQIASPMGEPLVQLCRGIILDEGDAWRVVARPFDKFFNHGEEHAASIDWSTARVQEKVDGSLCYLYFYEDLWHVATSGLPDARGEYMPGASFASLFWQTFTHRGWDTRSLQPGLTYIFELTSPMTRIVVRHTDDQLTLLAIRDSCSGVYLPLPDNAPRVVREFPLRSLDDVFASFTGMAPLEQEGYVIVDAQGNRVKVKHPGYVALHRVKVKHPGYVALHHLRGNGTPTPRRLLELVRQAEVEEVLVHWPEWAQYINPVKNVYEALVARAAEVYNTAAHYESQKDFALAVLKTPEVSGFCFAHRKTGVGPREYFRNTSIQSLMRTLNLADTPEPDPIE